MKQKMTVGGALHHARRSSGLTQEQLAERLNISDRTVRMWEHGEREPSVSQSMEWFRCTGVNPIPYLLCYAHPDKFSLDDIDQATQIGEAYEVITKNLSTADKIALTYLFSGAHGSSPSSVVQLTLMHLNNPMRDRIMVAEHILEQYRFNEKYGTRIGTEDNRPDVELLERSIRLAKESIDDGRKGYVDVPKVCRDNDEH